MLTTRFTELVGCTVPIQQAGMGAAAPPELAAAVSNAGGLGMLGTARSGAGTRPALERLLDQTRALTDRPFGVNFLIAAFLMISLIKIWHAEDGTWLVIPFGIFVSYFATIAANTVRISLAIKLHRMEGPSIWANPEQLHRFQGIFIYFGFLMLMFVLLERVHRQASNKSRLRYWIPLSVYWLMTLGVPILSGAHSRGVDPREHFVFVVATPVMILMPLLAFEFFGRAKANSIY